MIAWSASFTFQEMQRSWDCDLGELVHYSCHLVIFWFALSPLTVSAAPAGHSLPVIAANDNRTPAGQLHAGVLDLRLELREGRWYPENDGGPYRDIFAFGEAGKPPQNSGPLIRVPPGTQIHATVRNALALAADVYGLHTHPGDAQAALHLAPGESRELRFTAGEPGSYLYWASTSGKPLKGRDGAETGLSGAFLVDPPGARPDDRVFVIGLWTDVANSQEIATLNGKSWPYAGSLTYRQGDAIHWRVLNPTLVPHAMHLHGFYFHVDGDGDGESYRRYAANQRREEVTELIDIGHVFDLTWNAERAGNWLFHCHMTSHMVAPEALHPKDGPPDMSPEHMRSGGMGGLVVGITILPVAASTATATPTTVAATRKLQLVIVENPDKVPKYRLQVIDPLAPAKDSKSNDPVLTGPPIILTRGETTEIEVRNLSNSPTAIHWHGIELDSYYDGVPGWTGSGQHLSPAIEPASSFIARMTPPRAGTFIYHTHWHDSGQLANTVYGPLIVLEPGEKYDPDHDRTFLVSSGDYAPFGPMLLLNGSPEPYPMELKTGTRYRFRLINIMTNESELRVRLVSPDLPVHWTLIAQDAVDVPMAQQSLEAAELPITVGSTRDVVFQSDRPGYFEMQVPARLFGALVMLPITVVAPK